MLPTSGTSEHALTHAFALSELLPLLEQTAGTPGVWLFALGLFGAGLSSALTVGLGTALAIEDSEYIYMHVVAAPAALATHDAASNASQQVSLSVAEIRPRSSSVAEIRPRSSSVAEIRPPEDAHGGGSGGGGGCGSGGSGVLSRGRRRRRRRLRAWLVESMWWSMLRSTRWSGHGKACFYVALFALGALPALLRVPTISVIQLAQVINGCLLPIIAALLMIALNDHALMRGQPQSLHLNVLMAPCAGMTLFLASVVLLDQSVGRLVSDWSGGRSMQVRLRLRVRVRVGVRVRVRVRVRVGVGVGASLGLRLSLRLMVSALSIYSPIYPRAQLAAPITLGSLVALLCAVRRARRQHVAPASTGPALPSRARGGAAREADVGSDWVMGEGGRGGIWLVGEVEFEVRREHQVTMHC